MKMLLIGFFGRTYIPYIEKYESVLSENNVKYDVAFFERTETKETSISACEHGYEYTFYHETNTNSFSKLIPAIKYFGFVKKLIKKNKYDKIIVFTTMPAVFLSRLLIKRYDGNYIFDYRDYTYEKNRLFRYVSERVMQHAAYVCFSSAGYLNYYKNIDSYLITHNICNDDKLMSSVADLRSKDHIVIGFLGYVRYFSVNCKLIDTFTNSDQYSLFYGGTAFSDCDLQTYCKENGINNVVFEGRYDNSQKPNLYRSIDIINSIYDLQSPEVKEAIPNRIYDSAIYKKPIIVSKGTYLQKIVEKYRLGIAVDPFHDDIQLMLKDYLSRFDKDEFLEHCNHFLEDVRKDQEKHLKTVKSFCTNKGI